MANPDQSSDIKDAIDRIGTILMQHGETAINQTDYAKIHANRTTVTSATQKFYTILQRALDNRKTDLSGIIREQEARLEAAPEDEKTRLILVGLRVAQEKLNTEYQAFSQMLTSGISK